MIQSFDLKIANHNSNLITIMILMTLKVNISMEWRKYVYSIMNGLFFTFNDFDGTIMIILKFD